MGGAACAEELINGGQRLSSLATMMESLAKTLNNDPNQTVQIEQVNNLLTCVAGAEASFANVCATAVPQIPNPGA